MGRGIKSIKSSSPASILSQHNFSYQKQYKNQNLRLEVCFLIFIRTTTLRFLIFKKKVIEVTSMMLKIVRTFFVMFMGSSTGFSIMQNGYYYPVGGAFGVDPVRFEQTAMQQGEFSEIEIKD